MTRRRRNPIDRPAAARRPDEDVWLGVVDESGGIAGRDSDGNLTAGQVARLRVRYDADDDRYRLNGGSPPEAITAYNVDVATLRDTDLVFAYRQPGGLWAARAWWYETPFQYALAIAEPLMLTDAWQELTFSQPTGRLADWFTVAAGRLTFTAEAPRDAIYSLHLHGSTPAPAAHSIKITGTGCAEDVELAIDETAPYMHVRHASLNDDPAGTLELYAKHGDDGPATLSLTLIAYQFANRIA